MASWRVVVVSWWLWEARAWHARAYPKADWKGANEQIGRAIRLADKIIKKAGKWPQDQRFIGNDQRLALLAEIEG